MQISTRAIVLHNTKYSESSIITKLFTEQLGVVSYIVNGVRSSKAKNKASFFQPSTLLEIQAIQRENKNLQRLIEYKRIHTFETIPFQIKKTAVAQFITETLYRAIQNQDPNFELFDFAFNSIVFLDKTTELNPDFHLIFLLHLSRILGFAPNGKYTSITPIFDLQEGTFVSQPFSAATGVSFPQSKFISELQELSSTTTMQIVPNGKERNAVLQYILNYFRYHIAGFGNMKSPEILKAIFE